MFEENKPEDKKRRERMKGKIKLILQIISLVGLTMAVGGVVSLLLLKTTVMQVNFNGDSSTSNLYAGMTYRLVASSGGTRGTICLFFDSNRIFRRTIDVMMTEGDYVYVGSFQVKQSGVYTLTSIEPQVGVIAIQVTPIQSILGIDEMIFAFVGFAFLFGGVISARMFGTRV